MPCTSPLELTLAIPVLPLAHTMLLPVKVLLLASRVVAVSWDVAPVWMLTLAGETETDATGTGGGALEAVVVPEAIFDSDPKTAF